MRYLTACAAFLSLPVCALAQGGVTAYGLLDEAMLYTSHASANGSLVQLKSGGMNTSRVGIRGAEEMGQGLKAVLQLESGVRLDTGVQDDATALFNRQSVVGIEGPYGRLVVGRSFSATYDAMLQFDPMGYAPVSSWALAGSATPGNAGAAVRKDGMLSGVSNLIKYAGKAGPVAVGASYGAGEEAGSASASAKYDAALTYTAASTRVVAAFGRQNGAANAVGAWDRTEVAHLGVKYNAGHLIASGGYRRYHKSFATAAPAQRGSTAWFGLGYGVTPALTLTAALYHQHFADVPPALAADPWLAVGRARYGLSARTELYAILARAQARHGLNVGASRDEPGFDSQQNNVALGVQHRF
jgi:predicted porin